MTNAVERHSSKTQAAPQSIDKPITWLGLSLAMFVVLFLPKGISPRVFKSTWKKAIAVLLISTALSVGLLFGRMILDLSGKHTIPPNHVLPSHAEPPAMSGFVENIMLVGSRCVNYLVSTFYLDSTAMLSGLIVPIAFVVTCPFLSVLLMPLLPGRLNIGQRYLRSLRAVFWASVVLIPMSVAVATSFSCYEWNTSFLKNSIRDTLDFAGLGVFGVWFVFVAGRLVSSCRKTGEEYDSGQVVPRCIKCGYTLYGLPVDSRCPECGQASRLPHSRLTEQTPWAAASSWGKPMAYVRTTWQVVLGNIGFGNHVTCKERSDALAYMVVTSILAGVSLSLIGYLLLENGFMYNAKFKFDGSWDTVELRFYSVPCGLMFFGSLAFFMSTLQMALLASCFYRRNWNMNFVVTAYSSSNFLIPIILVVLVVVLSSILQSNCINTNRNFLVFGTSVCLESIYYWSVVVFAIVLLFRAIGNLIKALYLSRFSDSY